MTKIGRPEIAPAKRKSKYIALRMSESSADKLRAAAAIDGMSVSELIRAAVEKYIWSKK